MLTIFIILLVGYPTHVFADWTNLGLYGGQVYELSIDPDSPNKMFAGAYYGDGLFRTNNGGATWEPVLTGHEDGELDGEATFRNTAVWAVKIAPSNSNIIWVAHNYWLEKSTDGGSTWTHIPNSTIQQTCTNCGGVDDDFRYIESLVIDPEDPNIVYVGASGGNGSDSKGAVYKTTDGGNTWTKLGITGLFMAGGYSVNLDHEFFSTVVDLAIHPTDSNIIWALDFNDYLGDYRGFLYLSTDGGDTWNWDIGIPAYIAEQGLAVKPDEPNVVFIGNFGRSGAFGGIFRVEYPTDEFGNVDWNGSITWTAPLGYGNHNVRALAFDPQNDNILYAAAGLNNDFILYKSLDGGDTFTEYPQNQLLISLAPHPINSSLIFGGGLTQGVFKGELIDSEYSWTSMNEGFRAIRVNDIAVDPNNPNHLVAATMAGVYEKQGDNTWAPTSSLPYSQAYSVAFDPSDTSGSTYYAGIESYLVKTTDNGTTWNYSNSLGYPHWVDDIAIDPNNNNTLFVTTRYPGAIYKSTDAGSTLTDVMKFSAILDNDVSHGTLNLNEDGSFSYTHNNDDATTDSFTYHINDGITNSGTATVTINITPTADSPVAVSDTYSMEKGGALTRFRPGVLSNDVGNDLDASVDTSVSHGTLAFYTDGSFTYIHNGDNATVDTFTYHVNDGSTDSNIATVTINLGASLSPPVAINDQYTVGKGRTLTVTHSWKWFPIGVLHNDVKANNFDFNAVVVDPSDSSHIFAGAGDYFGSKVLGKLYESNNGGNTWLVALDNVIVNALLIDPDSTDIIYAGCGHADGTEIPLYKSSDGGQTWLQSYEGIPGAPARYGIWGNSANDMFILRHTESVPKGGFDDRTILHYNGSNWSLIDIGTSTTLFDIWGTGSEYFAVGESGKIVHYTGGDWTELSSGTTEDMYGVWGASENSVFAVGNAGTIFNYNGSSWSSMTSGTTQDLISVWGSASNNVFTVGSYGTILHYNGNVWSKETSGVKVRLEDVWGSSRSDVFAVGSSISEGENRYYTVLHYNGSSWSRMTNTPAVPSGKSGKLRDVWGSASNNVWAVGDDGIILNYNGTNWSLVSSGTTDRLYGVWGSSSNNVYAVGLNGAILFYNGIWSPFTILEADISNEKTSLWNAVTDLKFSPIDEVGNRNIYAITNRQGIYTSTNQAKSWVNLSAPPYELYAVATGSVIIGGNAGAYTYEGEGILYGKVNSLVKGSPIEDATVETDYGKSTTTASDGNWQMNHLSGENLTVTATKPGYVSGQENNVMVYDATFTYVDFDLNSTYTVTFSAGSGGSITGTSVQTVPHGADCSQVTAVPDTGYGFSGWTGDHTSSINPLTVTNVTSDMAIIAYFSPEDADGDSMPDAWEQKIVDADPNDNITSIDDVNPKDDFDNDGWSNLIEYKRGTDPTNPNSHPTMTIPWIPLLLDN